MAQFDHKPYLNGWLGFGCGIYITEKQKMKGLFLLMLAPLAAANAPLFPNSVVSNDLEFIETKDQSTFTCLSYRGAEKAEMPDKRNNGLFVINSHIFTSYYTDGTAIELWAHPDFGSPSSAQNFVAPVAQAIGKLPIIMRMQLDHVVIHQGDETAFAEADGRFFVVYSDNIKSRIKSNDLEETIFHESVHATIDAHYSDSQTWQLAQQNDGAFITHYAANFPTKEDLAESALFAWAVLMHPGRLPHKIETQVKKLMPHRLDFFEELFASESIIPLKIDNNGC